MQKVKALHLGVYPVLMWRGRTRGWTSAELHGLRTAASHDSHGALLVREDVGRTREGQRGRRRASRAIARVLCWAEAAAALWWR